MLGSGPLVFFRSFPPPFFIIIIGYNLGGLRWEK